MQTLVYCLLLMIEPMSEASSSGSPILSAVTFFSSFFRKLSKMSSCRNMREPAVQLWLWRVKRMALMMPSTAQSSSASG